MAIAIRAREETEEARAVRKETAAAVIRAAHPETDRAAADIRTAQEMVREADVRRMVQEAARAADSRTVAQEAARAVREETAAIVTRAVHPEIARAVQEAARAADSRMAAQEVARVDVPQVSRRLR